jgi:hypothetical protein
MSPSPAPPRSRLRRLRRLLTNRAVIAAAAGTLVWFADQPTVEGYNPLLEMFWDPGIFHMPSWDTMVMICSWSITTLFCHFMMFAIPRLLRRRSA